MSRNYDTTNKQPFPRIMSFTVDYPLDSMPILKYEEAMFIIDGEGKPHELSGGRQTYNAVLDLTDDSSFSVYHPVTNAVIPTMSCNYQELLLDIYAVIHKHQLARDAAEDSAGE